MSERTTIGGTVYETVGSSSSNLLLKCNGTARIQWGSKLIDLIKDGKIAAPQKNQEFIFEISKEEDANKDGLYILTSENEDNKKLFIFRNGQKYTLNEVDLYISANSKQEITVEQQKQALANLGLYYNTLAEVPAEQIQNGLVYVLETNLLYSIKSGAITEYQAQLKTVTVEQKQENTETDVNESRSSISPQAQPFSRGMIIMYYSSDSIPEGWAICDGQEYTYENVTSKTPNLSDLFKNESDEYSLIYIMKL